MLAPDDVRRAIATEDLAALTRVPGIGRKGAERIVLELRDKIGALDDRADAPPRPAHRRAWRDQVARRWSASGWSGKEADEAVASRRRRGRGRRADVAALLRRRCGC